MNTKNNKRRQETKQNIENVFLNLLQTKDLGQISVSDICKKADINRSTFYANYSDIYDLADKLKDKLDAQVAKLYSEEHEARTNSNDYLKLFRHIYDNQILYSTYFKLGYDGNYKVTVYDSEQASAYFNNRFIDYHIEFFMRGLNAIIKKWLAEGCRETPEEMMEILESEYKGRGEI